MRNLQHTASKQVKTFSFLFRLYKLLGLVSREKNVINPCNVGHDCNENTVKRCLHVLPLHIFFRFF